MQNPDFVKFDWLLKYNKDYFLIKVEFYARIDQKYKIETGRGLEYDA